MVNVGENRARNGVTDCPKSRNEDKVEKWKNLAAQPYPRGKECFQEKNIFKHRPRSRRKCDIEVPAAVGQDLSTVVRKTVYDMMV
ncbi:hypothetical protein E3N88_41663 [Mikania micrantha]|uniref:Uncharacterized protein n=1 Tax=Mikania micrantha TaxID=192012 RepID=A0A5N6LK11_9ASTR|nr:hypothetical protein E3N88_41663 [Mikania micrantha]